MIGLNKGQFFMNLRTFIANSFLKIVRIIINILPDSDISHQKLQQILAYKRKYTWSKFIRQYLRSLIADSKPAKFEAEVGITAIVKNEAPYIKEWIEYHKLVGVEKFYIYDNESTDDLIEVIQPYINANEVVYKYFPGECVQNAAYQDSIENNSNKVKFMAFIDLDEFITPLKHNTITEYIKNLESKIGHKIDALGVNWLIHGFNGHFHKPDGLVCKNFSRCSFSKDINKHIKSIVNPRSVVIAHHPHYFIHRIGSKIVNTKGENIYGPFSETYFEEIVINHYITKSYEEYEKRMKKGKADGSNPVKFSYSPDLFSEDENTFTERFIPVLHEKLNSK